MGNNSLNRGAGFPRPHTICHMTSGHIVTDVRIFQKECRFLAKAGYNVVLIAPHDHDEVIDGVSVRAVSIPNGLKERLTSTMWKILKLARKTNADVYHFHDPELILIGLILKLGGRKVIYDAHEDYPNDFKVRKYLNSPARTILSITARFIEYVAGKMFDGIVTVIPKIAARFPYHKTVITSNYPVISGMDKEEERQSHKDGEFVVAYIGTIGEYRGIIQMIRAVDIINKNHSVRLALAGSFSDSIMESTARSEPGWKYVDYFGWLSHKDVKELLRCCHLGIILLQPIARNLETSPNKLFEYMQFGLPVIMSDYSFWRKDLDPYNCGIFVDPTDPVKVAEAICWIIEHPEEAKAMGGRGQDAVKLEFNWEREMDKLLCLYKKVLCQWEKSL